MKISKKSVRSVKASKEVKATTKYSRSQKHILAAIDALSKDAKDDVLAKSAIADLSVVLLELSK